MRIINKQKLIETVRQCCIEGATLLPEDVLQAMKMLKLKSNLPSVKVFCRNVLKML